MKLYKHQIEGINFILKNNGIGALYFEPGLGKTLTTLTIFNEFKKNQLLKLLVVCPLTLIHNAWIEDIKKFTQFTYQDLHNQKELNNIKNVDIYLCNYEMFLGKNKFEKIENLISKNIFMIAIDESSRMKNASSLTTKKLLSIRNQFKYRILLSGSPAPNSEEEYYSQMKFLADCIFSHSFYTFRSCFFHLQRGKQVMEIPCGSFITKDVARKIFSQGFKYEITDNKRKELMEAMRPWVMFRKLEDCVDLPESIEIIRKFDLSKEQSVAYKDMKDELVAELKGQFIAAPFALTKISKLRQLTSGFLLNAEGQALDFAENAKLNELKEVLEELGNKQVIIWTWFQHEAMFIKNLLGDKARIINGTVNEEEKNEAIKLFKEGSIQYLIANTLSVAHGLTLVNSHYCIYYSLSYSHEQHYQSIHRIMRIGQTNKCFYIYLLANGTIDEIILGVLKRKGKEEEIVKELLK